MPHALTELNLAEVTRPAATGALEIRADVCVVGAGIAGLSAAVESARLGRDVVLVDALPLIGGQMVHSLIGLFCGVFGNAPAYQQLTHGIFDDIFRDLGPSGDLHFQRGHTTTAYVKARLITAATRYATRCASRDQAPTGACRRAPASSVDVIRAHLPDVVARSTALR